MKLGVADNFREFVVLPVSSVTFNMKSGNVTRFSFFFRVPVADVGEESNRVSDARVRPSSITSRGVMVLIRDNGRVIGSSKPLPPSPRSKFRSKLRPKPKLLSSMGLLEYELRFNIGDGVRLPTLDGELSKFRLLLMLLLLLPPILLLLARNWLGLMKVNGEKLLLILLLLLLKPKLRLCNRLSSSWFDWNKSVWSILSWPLALLFLLLLILLAEVIGTFCVAAATTGNAFPKFWYCCKFWLCWFNPLNCWLNVFNCWLIVPKLFNCWLIAARLLLLGDARKLVRVGDPHSALSPTNNGSGD